MPRKRRIIVYVATSADGFIARLDGSVDWLDRPHPKGNYGGAAFFRSIDTCILGRKTYDFSVSHGQPDFFPGMKNYVFSRTLKQAAGAKVILVSEDVAAFAKRLRAEKGKDIWLVGGAELVAAFLDCGQVDEFIIHAIPVMIGEGIPLAAPRHRDLPLKLLASQKFPDGSSSCTTPSVNRDIARGAAPGESVAGTGEHRGKSRSLCVPLCPLWLKLFRETKSLK
jgi:dihydrofolate reductase